MFLLIITARKFIFLRRVYFFYMVAIYFSAKKQTNKKKMEEVIHYLDSLVTTMNPSLNTLPPSCHPCQKRTEDLDNSLQDYGELVNKLQ